jgi:putative DNA primase/helicase
MADEDRRALLRRTWAATQPVERGDLVDAYLKSRGLGEDACPADLRFAPRLADGEGGVRPCMVAMVRDREGRPATLHRTFLRPDGMAKAEMPSGGARKLMPGEIPAGSAVRLFGFHGGPLGIAEGIETALAAAMLYEIPVWATISAPMMAKWSPPEGCDEVIVFADNDAKFAGQAAAYRLANRIATQTEAEVCVRMPDAVGRDWADVWAEQAIPMRKEAG